MPGVIYLAFKTWHLSAKAHPVLTTQMVPKRTNSPRVPKTPGCKIAVTAKKVPASNTARDRKSATSISVMSASRRNVAGEVVLYGRNLLNLIY